jgi:hypothetical protein
MNAEVYCIHCHDEMERFDLNGRKVVLCNKCVAGWYEVP